MDQTPNLQLPYILPSQAQKHVTHNEALRLLDAVVHLSVASRTLTEPPATPAEGSRYIAAAPAAGGWAGKDGMVACYVDGGWLFAAPLKGWLAYVEAEAALRVFDGAAWVSATALPDTLTPSLLGVGATPDATNRLAVAAAASLFNNAGAGHQIKVNKQAATDTASLLFQTNWTGFAEMGLNGGNNFSVKVADDGGAWREALRVERATGNVAVGSVTPQARLQVDGAIRPATYAKAALPSASGNGAGALVFVSNSANGAEMAFSDGTAWRSIRTGAVIA